MKKKSIEILKIVQKMQIETGVKKLEKKCVAERMGMSRQGLHKYKGEVYDYIEGKYPVDLALKTFTDGSDNPYDLLFEKYEQTVKNLNALQKEFDSKLETQKMRLVTSLMQDDVLAHLSSNLRKDKEQALLHNDELTRQIKKLELQLAAANSGPNTFIKENKIVPVLVKINLSPVFLNYKENKEEDVYEDEKDAAIEGVAKKVKRLLVDNKSPIVLFVDRYLCRFDKFAQTLGDTLRGSIVVQLPLFDRIGIREFIDNIGRTNPIHIYIPVCQSDTLKKAQRQFFSSSVPEIEIRAADNEYIPSVKEGFASTVTFSIKQGD